MTLRTLYIALATLLLLPTLMAQVATEAASRDKTYAFAAPVQLEADGKPIDIGSLSKIAHAGPWLEDVDGDGDRDLLVGDFPGHFWLFDNEGTNKKPKFTAKGKLKAGGKDAKTPVY